MKKPVTAKVAADQMTEGVILKLGPKAARLNIEVTDSGGTPIKSAVQLYFDRDDIPGPYSRGARARESLLVPPVPFRLTVEAEEYKPWKSGVIELKSGETLDLAVRLSPSPGFKPQ